MLLAGVTVEDSLILRLAAAVDDFGLARKLKLAHTLRSQVLNLTIAERQRILAVVEDPRSGLEDLRELLVANQAWRLRERL